MFQTFARSAAGTARATLFAVGATAVMALAAAGPVSAQATKPQAKVVATVDGAPITAADLALAAEVLGPRLARVPEEMRQRVLLDVLVDRAMFTKAARAAKVMDMAEYKAQVDYYSKDALRDIYVSVVLDKQISEADVRARYDAEVAKQPKVDEMRASHILLKTEDEAKDIAKQLAAGGDFVELAKSKSVGPSAQRGGDLGYFTAETMVPEFSAALKTMKIGAISAPVKTQFGWHVIKLVDKRARKAPPFEKISANLRQLLLSEKVRQQSAILRKDTVVEYKDPSLKPSDR